MAETVYLNDGSMEVIFEDKDVFLERLLREKLGDDVARCFRECVAELKEEIQEQQELVKDYEGNATAIWICAATPANPSPLMCGRLRILHRHYGTAGSAPFEPECAQIRNPKRLQRDLQKPLDPTCGCRTEHIEPNEFYGGIKPCIKMTRKEFLPPNAACPTATS